MDFMPTHKKTDTGEVEKKPDAPAADTVKVSPDEKEADLDLDAEIKKEQDRQQKPDPTRAREEFKTRKQRRADRGDDDEEKEDAPEPLTRADLDEVESRAEQRAYRRLQQDQALALARSFGTNEKEAQLVFLKWQNRQWPSDLPLADQLEEAYAVTFRKKIIGERTEALRALRNKPNANDTSAETHRDATSSGEPNLPAQDKAAMKASGFVWDGSKGMYRKPIKGRGFLNRDPKSGKTFISQD